SNASPGSGQRATRGVSTLSSPRSSSRRAREMDPARWHTSCSCGAIEVVPASAEAIRRIALLGNHMPRQCGIATFTTDLSAAIAGEFSAVECFVLAMNDPGRRHAYPARVRFEIAESDVAS